MEWNIKTILIMAAVLFVGYGIGLVEMHLRRQKKIKQLEDDLAAKQNNLITASLPSAISPAKPVSLSLWTGEDQTLKVELDGRLLESPTLVTPEQVRRLVSLLTGIRPWVEGRAVAPASKTEPAAVPKTPPESVKQPGKTSEPEKPGPEELSIVAQIDAVLQTRMKGTPLADKHIRLSETPAGSVIVMVGTARYEGLDVVPDSDVVAAIRAAIAEWERNVK